MNVDLSNIYGGADLDCKKFHHIPHNIPHSDRTIAIGDIHGDLDVAVRMLEVANCIKQVSNKNDETVTLINKSNNNEYYIWTGGTTIVVQVGDQVDRCRPVGDDICIYQQSTFEDEASDIKILKFYTDVNEIAMKKGGKVISLLGNHELMNVLGQMKYVSYEGLKEFIPEKKQESNNVNIAKIGLDNRKLAFSQNKDIKEKQKILKNVHSAFINGHPLNEYLACTRLSSVIIGNMIFVHGGMVKKLAQSYKLENLNKIVQKWLLGTLNAELLSTKKLLTTVQEEKNDKEVNFNVKERINQLLTSDQSVFWNRILAYLPVDVNLAKCDELLSEVFKIYDVNGIIIGHTPSMSGIESRCDDRIWKVDIGASNAFHNFKKDQKIEVLEITYNKNGKAMFKVLK